MASGETGHATGKYTGTGAAKDVALPFAPKIVIIVNLTDSIIGIKTDKQPAANHTQIAANGTISQITSEGVTIPDPPGTATLPPTAAPLPADIWKFSLGTNAGVNGSAKDCMYMAWE